MNAPRTRSARRSTTGATRSRPVRQRRPGCRRRCESDAAVERRVVGELAYYDLGEHRGIGGAARQDLRRRRCGRDPLFTAAARVRRQMVLIFFEVARDIAQPSRDVGAQTAQRVAAVRASPLVLRHLDLMDLALGTAGVPSRAAPATRPRGEAAARSCSACSMSRSRAASSVASASGRRPSPRRRAPRTATRAAGPPAPMSCRERPGAASLPAASDRFCTSTAASADRKNSQVSSVLPAWSRARRLRDLPHRRAHRPVLRVAACCVRARRSRIGAVDGQQLATARLGVARVDPRAHRVDHRGGDVRHALRAVDHEGQRPAGVPAVVRAVTARRAAAIVAERQRARQPRRREREPGEQAPPARLESSDGRAVRHLAVIIHLVYPRVNPPVRAMR